MEIDSLMPQWHYREQQRIAINQPTSEVMNAVRNLTWGEVPLFRLLVLNRFGPKFKKLESGGRILDTLTEDAPFRILAQTPDELVFGVILSRTRRPAPLNPTATEFQQFAQAGTWKELATFYYVEGQLVTESRVIANDTVTKRLFGMYWKMIVFPSGLIRIAWLKAIRKHCLSAAGSQPIN